ncbi:Proto-oncogene tyrosine-protein kinase receptor Ret [Orchesella cincta]|uniref:Proto-oncogene tyrosine-protein kinase receptor Ret n=1 Tax=Orchesella cincta TaxID=48709 RepID=A0A1D2M0R3_ORCCI|nr:Proto-oncogene tyrosine-protein kinase receptor Ret [Orchesella cincta]
MHERKRKARSLNQSVMMTAAGIEIGGGYGDNTGNGTLISNAEYGPGGMNHAVLMVSDDQFEANQIVQVDIKWEIHRDDLTLEHVLGEGQFGRVLKGKLRGHSEKYVRRRRAYPCGCEDVESLKVDAAEGSKSLWQEFMAEFSLLKQVDHPNVIKLLGACTTTGGPPYIVMEYAEYGALRSFLRKCRRVEKINGSHSALHWDNPDSSVSPASDPYVVTPREVLGFSWQIAKGMAYLSDMKRFGCHDILLTRTKACKISDFGLTRDIYWTMHTKRKSKDRCKENVLAPECLADELYTTKSDVWAFGVLVWELTTLGASPYPGIPTEQLYSLLNTGYRMHQPENCSIELYSLMMRCWAYQPTSRPTFHQIVQELFENVGGRDRVLETGCSISVKSGYDYFSESDRTGSENE